MGLMGPKGPYGPNEPLWVFYGGPRGADIIYFPHIPVKDWLYICSPTPDKTCAPCVYGACVTVLSSPPQKSILPARRPAPSCLSADAGLIDTPFGSNMLQQHGGGTPRTIWTFNPDLQSGRSTRTFNPDPDVQPGHEDGGSTDLQPGRPTHSFNPDPNVQPGHEDGGPADLQPGRPTRTFNPEKSLLSIKICALIDDI
jgi:hypothetical protein